MNNVHYIRSSLARFIGPVIEIAIRAILFVKYSQPSEQMNSFLQKNESFCLHNAHVMAAKLLKKTQIIVLILSLAV